MCTFTRMYNFIPISLILAMLSTCCDSGVLMSSDYHVPDGQECEDHFECVSGFCAEGYCQQKSVFPYQMGTRDDDIIKDIAIDKTGAIYVVGDMYGQLFVNAEEEDSLEFLIKFTPEGQLIWLREVHKNGDSEKTRLMVNHRSEVAVVGYEYNYSSGIRLDHVIWQFDSEGTFLSKTALDTEEMFWEDATVNNQGNLFLISARYAEVTIMEYTFSGEKIWHKTLDLLRPGSITDIAVDDQDNIWFSAYASNQTNIEESSLCRYSKMTDQMTCERWGDESIAESIEISSDGHIFSLARKIGRESDGKLTAKIHIREFTGDLESPATISNELQFDLPVNVKTAVTEEGEIIFAGNENRTCKDDQPYEACVGSLFFGQLDREMNTIELKSVEPNDVDALVTGIAVNTDGRFYVVGATTGSFSSEKNQGGWDGFVSQYSFTE